MPVYASDDNPIYELVEKVEAAMDTRSLAFAWTPDDVARAADLTTDEAQQALAWMHARRYINGDDTGRAYYRKQMRTWDDAEFVVGPNGVSLIVHDEESALTQEHRAEIDESDEVTVTEGRARFGDLVLNAHAEQALAAARDFVRRHTTPPQEDQ